MNKSQGFTLVEFIFSLLLTAILAGVIIQILAGPITTYFWATQRTKQVEQAILSLDMLNRDLSAVFVNSLQLENENTKQSIIFKRILSSGVLVNEEGGTGVRLLSTLPKTLKENQHYIIYFPYSVENKDKYFDATLKKSQDNLSLDFAEKLNIANNHPELFYILSNPVEYQCEATSKSLKRLIDKDAALVSNQVKGCHFALNGDKKSPTLFISLEMDSQQKEPIKLTRPILLGEGL